MEWYDTVIREANPMHWYTITLISLVAVYAYISIGIATYGYLFEAKAIDPWSEKTARFIAFLWFLFIPYLIGAHIGRKCPKEPSESNDPAEG